MKKKLFENVGGNMFKLKINEDTFGSDGGVGDTAAQRGRYVADTNSFHIPDNEWNALEDKIAATNELPSIEKAAEVLHQDLKQLMIKYNISEKDDLETLAYDLFQATAFDPADWVNKLRDIADEFEPQKAVDHSERDYGQNDWD